LTGTTDTRTNWFDQGGRSYALFRPEYPPELSAYLASISPQQQRALDVGCGTGQLTLQLADHFRDMVGLDPSKDQLDNAPAHERVTWLCSPAENIPVNDGSVDLIVAAQAAHWFDRPAFYAEARRLAAPGAVLALISYGVLRLDDDTLNDRFSHFYRDEIGPFWPPERKLVDGGYPDIEFPFEELSAPALVIERDWDLGQFLGYISTWSAVRRAVEAGSEDLTAAFTKDISSLWGGCEQLHRVAWPLNMRIGRI
jgi:SAM-dependent methyltransferase